MKTDDHIRILREAILQVLCDYTNKKANMPMTTHAMLCNAFDIGKTEDVDLVENAKN